MKLLYLDCNMGAAGDMLMAALFELLDDKHTFLDAMNNAGIAGLTILPEHTNSHGIAGTHMCVAIHGAEEDDASAHAHHHHHHGMSAAEIYDMIDGLKLQEHVRLRAKKVYERIAAAEARVHGTEPGHVHFHELGSLDAVVDVSGVCLALDMLGVDRVQASPIRVGCGQVRCAHGLLPVPAPATAQLLLGLPSFGGDIAGEMCTPTGAALLAEIVDAFGPQPDMVFGKLGYGLGKRDFGTPNCVRAVIGETRAGQRGEIVELVCNIDDMTPEQLAFAQAAILDSGALDVYLLPGLMKKGRPGYEMTVLCAPKDEEKLARAVFAHTSTIGMRVRKCGKYFLTAEAGSVDTEFGPLQTKCSSGWGVSREKPEYSAAAALAKENNVSLQEIYAAYNKAKNEKR